MEHQPAICANILKIVRERSAATQPVRADEIWTELKAQGLLESADACPNALWEDILEHVLKENPDIKMTSGKDGIPHYFSVLSLSETYAVILIRKSEDPLWLIAEVVRENSRLYPRPVAVDSFRILPFDLSREELAECLLAMKGRQEYQDIAQTVTSIGTPFLYSTRHLDSDHAFTLAEWLDVGQASNP